MYASTICWRKREGFYEGMTGEMKVGFKGKKIAASLAAALSLLFLPLPGSCGADGYKPSFSMKDAVEEAAREVPEREELTRPVGTVLSYPGRQPAFAVSDPEIAEIFQENGEYRVRLQRPGKVLVHAVFPRPGGELPLVRQLLCEVTGTGKSKGSTAAAHYAERVLELCNVERQKAGLAPLRLEAELTGYAEIRVEETTRKFAHVRPNGKYCSSIMPFSYYSRFRHYGENLAGGQFTPEQAVQGWMNSPGHRANILNPKYKLLGVAYAYRPDSQFKHYWVQQFGTR